MKKVFILLVMIVTVILSSCSFEGDYDDGFKEGYDEGYYDGYEEGYDIGYYELKPVTRPRSGTILDGKEYDDSKITIEANSSNNYVVTLKSQGGRVLVSFFVRSGATVTVGVPARKCYVYFASGEEWYGYGEGLMFGEYTYYSMDDELADFDGNHYTYTLKSIEGGNFSETPISKNEFFS